MKSMSYTYVFKNTVNNPSHIEIQIITNDCTVIIKKHLYKTKLNTK